MPTTADLLVECLIDWGVDVIFGMPGDGIYGVFDALRTHQDGIRFIQVRHEEAAALMACEYSKFTGRPGVCIATSGPGGVHLANGLCDAALDGQPVLAITGSTYHDLIGTHQQQDVDLARLYAPVTVYSERINGPAHVTNVINEAMRRATGEHGVAHVTIPIDTQMTSTSREMRSERDVRRHSGTGSAVSCALPVPAELGLAREILNAGERVVILAGRGALGARAEVEQAAELLGAPIVKSLLGKGVVTDDSPYTTGGIGFLGTTPSVSAMQECDTLFIIGSSFPYVDYYPTPGQARCVQIDIDPARIGLRYPVDAPLVGSARQVLEALLPHLQAKNDRSFLERAQREMADWQRVLAERGTSDRMPMNPQVPARELNELLSPDAIITADTGAVTSWAARQIQLRDRQMFTASGNLATMACGLPYALAAQIAYPDRQVVALVGDGGFTMLMGELATAVKYNLPVKTLIFRNDALAEIKWEQLTFEAMPEFGVGLQPIDFSRVAEGFGVAGYSCERPAEVRSVLQKALAQPGPAVIQALVDANEPPLPPRITRQQALRFAETLVRGEPEKVEIAERAVREEIRQLT
jgi:pyruvate dehydrogenase (quinone)